MISVKPDSQQGRSPRRGKSLVQWQSQNTHLQHRPVTRVLGSPLLDWGTFVTDFFAYVYVTVVMSSVANTSLCVSLLYLQFLSGKIIFADEDNFCDFGSGSLIPRSKKLMLGYKQITLWSHDLNVTTTEHLTTQLLHRNSINWSMFKL